MTVKLPDPVALIDEVVKVGQEQPEYVYPNAGMTCRYFENDGTPSCVIGHAFKRLDVTNVGKRLNLVDIVEVYARVYGEEVYANYSETLGKLLRIQEEQDNGAPWGEAVKFA